MPRTTESEQVLGGNLSHEQAMAIVMPTHVETFIDALDQPDPLTYADFSVPAYKVFPNWSIVGDQLQEGACLVVFESVRKLEADETVLTKADLLAHAAAMATPGYLGYYKGPLTDDKTCRSFCLWQSEDAAKLSGSNPLHRAASSFSRGMYEQFAVKRYVLESNGNGQVGFRLVHEGGFSPSTQGYTLANSPRRA